MKKREMSITTYLILVAVSILLAAGITSIFGWTHYEVMPYGDAEHLVIKRSACMMFMLISMCCITVATMVGIITVDAEAKTVETHSEPATKNPSTTKAAY